ncbi:hypothetical protein H9P43_009269 [Blastocladiella emersonii ATCC 22665]|nr:hypothetical protein H9P43_009269 [Blastocladiella emersonii ATCC 22665]
MEQKHEDLMQTPQKPLPRLPIELVEKIILIALGGCRGKSIRSRKQAMTLLRVFPVPSLHLRKFITRGPSSERLRHAALHPANKELRDALLEILGPPPLSADKLGCAFYVKLASAAGRTKLLDAWREAQGDVCAVDYATEAFELALATGKTKALRWWGKAELEVDYERAYEVAFEHEQTGSLNWVTGNYRLPRTLDDGYGSYLDHADMEARREFAKRKTEEIPERAIERGLVGVLDAFPPCLGGLFNDDIGFTWAAEIDDWGQIVADAIDNDWPHMLEWMAGPPEAFCWADGDLGEIYVMGDKPNIFPFHELAAKEIWFLDLATQARAIGCLNWFEKECSRREARKKKPLPGTDVFDLKHLIMAARLGHTEIVDWWLNKSQLLTKEEIRKVKKIVKAKIAKAASAPLSPRERESDAQSDSESERDPEPDESGSEYGIDSDDER